MTPEKAIEAMRLEGGLEISGNVLRVAEFMEGLCEAEKALKKQIPKKLEQSIFDEDSMTCICRSDIDKDVEFRFCPWCGQRLKKWENN